LLLLAHIYDPQPIHLLYPTYALEIISSVWWAQLSFLAIIGKRSFTCLKELLEAENIPKIFFDVRNDSDALFHHFQISLPGVGDIQLMELATRTFSKKYVSGLQKCIENDAAMTIPEKFAWIAAKEKGMKLFIPEGRTI
jgi:hypothetical protein